MMLKHTRNQGNALFQISKNVKVWQHQGLARIQSNRNSQTVLLGAEICTTTLRNIWQHLVKSRMHMPYAPAILPPGTNAREGL